MQDTPISRARYVQENRKMRFQEAYDGWQEGRLRQAEAAVLLGQCERCFRRHIERFEADGMDGLLDRRLSQISKRRASSLEVDHVVQLYKNSFAGWNLAHFHSKYKAEFKVTYSAVRLEMILSFQTVEARKLIHRTIVEGAERFRGGGKIEIPKSAVLASSARPS